MMILLDGSRGEGGGQILRSALTLSILTGKPFRLSNVRANRPKPGLAAQHLMCVKAAAEICGGHYKGGRVGSTELFFEPGEVVSGKYRFTIGTAGSTSLVLQTVALPLMLKGDGVSEVVITGGTHNRAAPCFHFLAQTWSKYLERMNLGVKVEMIRPGFYPRGGGEIRAVITPSRTIYPLHLTTCPKLTTAGGFSAVASLPDEVNQRQSRRLTHRLNQAELENHIRLESWSGGPSTVAAVTFLQAPVPPLFVGLGERGKPVESVADEAADEAIAFRDSGCPVDPHSADQIVLPLVFTESESVFRVSEVTRHLLTNVGTIQAFLEREIKVEGEEGQSGTVTIPAGPVVAND
ncbi:MAG: RNA 3'-terminal phosphate cyclase [Gemmataceae bacterium]